MLLAGRLSPLLLLPGTATRLNGISMAPASDEGDDTAAAAPITDFALRLPLVAWFALPAALVVVLPLAAAYGAE